jgi:hypothetical protein
MKIKLLRNTVADGKQVSAGTIVTVSDAAGQTLVQMGKAQRVIEDPPIEATDTRTAEIEGATREIPAILDEAQLTAPLPPKNRSGKNSGKSKGGKA